MRLKKMSCASWLIASCAIVGCGASPGVTVGGTGSADSGGNSDLGLTDDLGQVAQDMQANQEDAAGAGDAIAADQNAAQDLDNILQDLKTAADAEMGPDATVASDSNGAGDAVAAVDTNSTNDAGVADAGAGCSDLAQCDDQDVCTTDSCNAGTCAHVSVANCAAIVPCDLKTPCANGICDTKDGLCVACVNAADCGKVGFLCQQNTCVAAAACKSDVECKATKQLCDKATGLCVDCVGDVGCAVNQKCSQNKCIDAKSCKSSKECDAVCDLVSGSCVQCVGNDDCAADQFCNAFHACQKDVCTTSSCAGNSAFFQCKADGSGFAAGVSCDDGIACTDGACGPTGCKQTANSAVCNDNNACTLDGCDPTKGCVFKALENGGKCDDNSICTNGDHCQNGACAGVATVCDDSEICTDNKCDSKTGCVFSANTASCDDGNFCTEKDACAGGKCVGGKPTNCEDGNSCTDDKCEVAKNGCFYVANSAACSDGSACTDGDKCNNGKCVAGKAIACADSDKCTVDSCDAVKGCVFSALVCDDGNFCTTDACDKASGFCVFSQTDSCCTPGKILFQQTFETLPPPAGMTFANSTNNEKQGWQIWTPTTNAKTGNGVLYYGDAKTLKYEFGDGGNNSGTAFMPEAANLPAQGKRFLKASLNLQIEKATKYDTLSIIASATNKADITLWTKSSLPVGGGDQGNPDVILPKGWFDINVEIPPSLGDKVKIKLSFHTVDANYNGTLGILVDDLQIVQQCN